MSMNPVAVARLALRVVTCGSCWCCFRERWVGDRVVPIVLRHASVVVRFSKNDYDFQRSSPSSWDCFDSLCKSWRRFSIMSIILASGVLTFTSEALHLPLSFLTFLFPFVLRRLVFLNHSSFESKWLFSCAFALDVKAASFPLEKQVWVWGLSQFDPSMTNLGRARVHIWSWWSKWSGRHSHLLYHLARSPSVSSGDSKLCQPQPTEISPVAALHCPSTIANVSRNLY